MRSAGHPNHVLMTADTIGGVWTYAIELSRGLCERGVSVTLAAMGDEPSARQFEEADIDGLDLEARPYKLEWMEDPWQDIAEASLWLTELAERTRPDLVHLNTFAHGTLPWEAPVLTVGHSCVASWFEAVKGEPAPASWDRYRQVVRDSLKASDMVAAPSTSMMQALQRHYGVLERTRVIYNGRNAADFLPADPDSMGPDSTGSDSWGRPGILTAGRLWDEAKNVAAVAEAAADIDWPVFVAGSDTHPDGGTIEMAGVEMLGRLDPEELARWYARTSIYALPARYEPFGLTALEAALAGNALVLGDIATLREIWGEAALFVDPDNPRELAETVNTLIADADRRRFLAGRARTRALQLSVEAMVEGYLDVYREMSAAAVSSSTTLTPRGGRN